MMSPPGNVETLLQEKDIEFLEKGKDYLIRCISPDHEESNPSCRVDRETGQFHCFSCGYKGNLFAEFNVDTNYVHQKSLVLRRKISDLLAETKSQEIPLDAIPFAEEYRDIKPETYSKFNTFYWESRVCIPIPDIRGRLVGFVGREKFSEENNKYQVTPIGAKMPIFPHKATSLTHFLVEGPFDMLNLHDKGLENSSCIFGAYNISDINDRLIPFQIQGVKRIAIMFDGDEPGRVAAEKLATQIKFKTTYDVVIIDVPEGKDPGSLTQEEVDEIKRIYSP